MPALQRAAALQWPFLEAKIDVLRQLQPVLGPLAADFRYQPAHRWQSASFWDWPCWPPSWSTALERYFADMNHLTVAVKRELGDSATRWVVGSGSSCAFKTQTVPGCAQRAVRYAETYMAEKSLSSSLAILCKRCKADACGF